MIILVLNSGSSSVKYQLLEMQDKTLLASGLVERIGQSGSAYKHERLPGTDTSQVFSNEQDIPDHSTALDLVVKLITGEQTGVIKDVSSINGIGHRIVHGGEDFNTPILVDDDVVEGIRAQIPLAPLHNPGGLAGIETAKRLMPGIPNVAVFDTAFHQTMPPEAYRMAIPAELYSELKIRRYGFHGTSHLYVAKQCAATLGQTLEQTSCITVHLGNGCSMAAVKQGRCVDTSMGLTPLAGLVMGTRSGDVDPALHAFLADKKGYSIQDIDNLLNKKSGLLGLCGDNDMRDIHARIDKGDSDAELALKIFCRRVTQYIGQYMAILDKTQAICFTAGVGENDERVRELSCATLSGLGVVLDKKRNQEVRRGEICEISSPESRVKVLVIPTNEELEIATQTAQVLSSS
ncbi:acetate kinase [Desulfonatronospira sp. MSAO_Bac3]|uniref:acetate kinase n=1 Tax=Desulfonatronospira sp. MSAO_Bac3 TaxID=2293857 RepID=UPI000FF638CD|nr:acetate kinase [Desulfonatronospira sp. MSAO_Bac3]RQD78273.1 MAG: acetate kinase [Desulfonatronospira sp. MSAO_Bac3]